MADNISLGPRLPQEVLREITQFLAASPSDLLSTSLASRTFREEAQYTLFRHPSRILFQQAEAKTYLFTYKLGRFSAFINAIVSSPDRLGPLVRTYTHKEGLDVNHEYLEKVNSALRSMTNLKRLAFSWSNPPPSVLHGCTFQLDAFHWEREATAMEILRDFLPTQPSLKHLTFRFHNTFASEGTIALAESICPSLKSLAGTQATVDLFIKGREVTYLQWDTNGCPPLTPKSLDLLGNLAQIQYLMYIPFPSRTSHLPLELLEKLRSLVLLETPMAAIEGKNRLTLLSQLSTLRVLILRDGMRSLDVALVQEVLTCCPHLLHVDLEIRAAVYQRFTRASLASTPMQGPIIGTDTDTPHSSSYVHAFTSISAFDGIDRYRGPSMFDDITFERDFGAWLEPGFDANFEFAVHQP